MILDAIRLAGRDLFAEETRAALWKTLGLTILLLIGAWFGLEAAFTHFALPPLRSLLPDLPDWTGWIGLIVGIVASIGLALGLALLIAPITSIVAGLFLDDVAEVIEREDYPEGPVGKALPIVAAIGYTIRFFGVVVAGNLVALLLLLVPGINVLAFFLVNGYLLGRAFFEFAAMRYRPEDEVKAMRRTHSATIFLAGLVIAGFLAVPILNLLTPLFAASLMVHLHQKLSARDGTFALPNRMASPGDREISVEAPPSRTG
ncbi:sulfate transporter family protein [Pararhizobium mangrovi]|uniref:Sulfate transporter family protein n=1 Tax=Pararhizobium mangrovi TaxID=2590452 RepID=A0A506U927_9HYPH|nr:sulfate transporter family protein [Pararhizobium mangrovi]TPW29856.1 sulfate transporter family protein [Pararhizobium mangrovi]